MNRRSFVAQGVYSAFLPFVSSSPSQVEPPTQAIYLPVPEFVPFLNLTNPQMFRDRAGVIFAATRTDSAIGGVVWRVDGYVDRDHPGVSTQLFLPVDPPKYFANGELQLWPDGFLRYVTVEVDNVQSRNGLAQVAYVVPGWTP